MTMVREPVGFCLDMEYLEIHIPRTGCIGMEQVKKDFIKEYGIE